MLAFAVNLFLLSEEFRFCLFGIAVDVEYFVVNGFSSELPGRLSLARGLMDGLTVGARIGMGKN